MKDLTKAIYWQRLVDGKREGCFDLVKDLAEACGWGEKGASILWKRETDLRRCAYLASGYQDCRWLKPLWTDSVSCWLLLMFNRLRSRGGRGAKDGSQQQPSTTVKGSFVMRKVG